jgi:hypothetical protein
MKIQVQSQILDFFERYAHEFNSSLANPDRLAEETAVYFSPSFLAAGPDGIHFSKNDAEFRQNIHKGYLFYKNIGVSSMEIISSEITALDKLHTLVKIGWKSSYVKDNIPGNIEFSVIYLVRTTGNRHHIFAYITGDEEKALVEHGLVPATVS